MLELVRPAAHPRSAFDWDDSQRAVLAERARVLVVRGGPGTGKTSLAVEIIADRVHRAEVSAAEVLVLAPTRRAAARLRAAVTLRVGATTGEPLARTPHSFAYGLLRAAAAADGAPAPRLITGPEQDVVLRELLAGHAATRAARRAGAAGDGGWTVEGSGVPDWPESMRLAVPTRTFRGELRDLLMRAIEWEVTAEDLADLGRRESRPEWVAAALVLREYEDVTALATPGAMDPAMIVGAAADLLTEPDPTAEATRRAVRLVVVDDAHELTPPAGRLLQALTQRLGPDLVLLADPDQTTQGFRGADPGLHDRFWPEASALTLTTGHRMPSAVSSAADVLAAHIGAAGSIRHRRARPAREGGSVSVHVLRTPAQEAAWIAEALRRRHLIDGLPWGQMAVIVRGGSRAATIARVLRRAEVPLVERSSDVSLADDPVVRPLLLALDVVLREVGGEAVTLTPANALELLGSDLGQVDAVALRRLRRALRRHELSTGGARMSDELLVCALLDPDSLLAHGPEAAGARRVARIIDAGRRAAASDGHTIETVLWEMWQASGLAARWQDSALSGGASGRRADRALDAVVALFEAAARYVDRLPGSRPEDFLEHLRGQELAADTIAARAPTDNAVEILTPADAAGRQWHTVVVAGVQEGVWPNLRVRGQLLGATDLVDLVSGRDPDPRAARTAVRHDETRLFHVALSRASEEVIVTAVRSDDEQPSVLLDLCAPGAGGLDERPVEDAPRPLSLVGLVAELRREVVGEDPARRGAALTALRRLREAGVRGADPAGWWALVDLSDDRPRRAEGIPVTISPSRLDRFATCQLQWFLSSCGGQRPGVGASQIGSLVHEIAHDLGDTSTAAYVTAVRERWPRLGLGDGWVSRKDRALAETMMGRLAVHVAAATAQGWERKGSEVPVSAALGRAVVKGRVDRVEVDGEGRVRIIDLKTGASKPSAAEIPRQAQLGAYQVAVDAGALGEGLRSAGAGLLQLGKAHSARTPLQIQPALSDDEDPLWAARQIAADAESMAGARFVARPSNTACGPCALQSSCPARPEGRWLV